MVVYGCQTQTAKPLEYNVCTYLTFVVHMIQYFPMELTHLRVEQKQVLRNFKIFGVAQPYVQDHG